MYVCMYVCIMFTFGKYSWKMYEFPYPPNNELNSITVVFLQGSL